MADDFRSVLDGDGPLGLVQSNGGSWGDIETSGDRDLFATTLVEGLTYTIEQKGSIGTLIDSYLYLQDDSGAPIASNDDYTTLDSLLTFTPTFTGTYYLQAAGFGSHIGTYGVYVSIGYGTADDDDITGSTDNDAINAGAGNDVIYGNGGHDTLYGDSGNDSLWLDAGTAYGGEGNDSLTGGYYSAGVTLVGGTGNDTYTIHFQEGQPLAGIVERAGEGTDTLWIEDFSGAYVLPSEIENLNVRAVDAVFIYGNEKANAISLYGYEWGSSLGTFYGMGGNDTLVGADNADILDGGSGADLLQGGYGNDTYYVDNALDRVVEVADRYSPYYEGWFYGGTDSVFSSVTYTLPTLVENLTLTGSATNGTGNSLANALTGNGIANSLSGLAGNDTLAGGTGNDTLSGGDGADSLNGNAGADSLAGGTGNDTYYVDNIADKVTETTAGTSGGTDIVYSSVSFTLGTNVESLRMIPGSGNVNGTGNASDNELWGTSGVNTLRGLGGADSFDSGSGADVIVGGTGNDVFKFSSTVGSDQTARDRIVAGDGAVAFEKPGASLGDRFDFSKMDANTGVAGQQHFVFGTSTGVGHIWAVTSGTDTLIRGNVDGDAAVEFEVAIADGSVSHTAYSAADFIL
ncbi:MAG: calcium-binding protein [Amaricoccus sp.]